jgi:ABC-type transporter MlaC component
MKRKLIYILALFFLFTLDLGAVGESKIINTLIDDLKAIQVPAKGKKLSRKLKKSNEKIKKRALARLNLDAMTKSALGGHFATLSKKQIENFRRTFKKLMLRNLSSSSGNNGGSGEELLSKYKIKVNPRELKKGKRVIVRSILSKKGEEDTEIDYIFMAGKITDISIDEESLTLNFREQFDEVIAEDGFSGLIKLMNDKLNGKKKVN